MKEKIVPMGTRVLVSREAPTNTTASGIILTSNETEKQRQFAAETRGNVVAMGDLAFAENPEEKPNIGDRVIIRRYSGVDVDYNEDYCDVIVDCDDIHALVIGE